MICSNCNQTLDMSKPHFWTGFAQAPIECNNCHRIEWVSTDWSCPTLFGDRISEIPAGTMVYITNREHPRFLQPAKIIDKGHLHLRLEFGDGVIFWMPNHWAKRLELP